MYEDFGPIQISGKKNRPLLDYGDSPSLVWVFHLLQAVPICGHAKCQSFTGDSLQPPRPIIQKFLQTAGLILQTSL